MSGERMTPPRHQGESATSHTAAPSCAWMKDRSDVRIARMLCRQMPAPAEQQQIARCISSSAIGVMYRDAASASASLPPASAQSGE